MIGHERRGGAGGAEGGEQQLARLVDEMHESSLRRGGRPRCGRNGSRPSSPRASRASITATSAATAANESWKLTPRIASGSSATIASTASARLRIVSARRSSITAPSTIKVMISARWVPTREPVAKS